MKKPFQILKNRPNLKIRLTRDSVSAGDDIFACPGNIPQLSATFDPDWEYLWSPSIIGGLPALSDPTVHDPLVGGAGPPGCRARGPPRLSRTR